VITDRPYVSAICITGKSQRHVTEFLPRAVECFEDQTYENTQLIVITDAFQDDVRNLWNGGRFRFAIARCAPALGDLRNCGLDLASGNLCIQWDDDDWHHPERIEKQVEAYLDHASGMVESASGQHIPRPVDTPVFLRRQLCYNFTTDTAFVREFDHTFLHGTILHRNRKCFRYPSLRVREDTEFLRHWSYYQVLDNEPELYIRFCHGKNTTDEKDIMQGHCEPGRWDLTEKQAECLRGVLTQYHTEESKHHATN